jgi:hypothetical protein
MMKGRQESASSRTRTFGVGVLALVVLGTALVLASASSGSTDGKQAATAKPVVVSAGKGFGEVYAAKASTLKHTLFKATLLPKDKTSRQIALAGLGRSDKKVNEALALRCWKSNGCKTGTGGKLTVAYIEQFGENVFRHISKMEFILQALTYKSIGKIIATRTAVDSVVTYRDDTPLSQVTLGEFMEKVQLIVVAATASRLAYTQWPEVSPARTHEEDGPPST